MATISASYWSTTRHGSDLSLSNRRSLDFRSFQWHHPYIHVLLLRMLHHEMGISSSQTTNYLPTNHPIYHWIRMLRVLLFHRRLLENPRKAVCVLFHLCVCLDEPSHVPQFLPDNLSKGWKGKICISEDAVKTQKTFKFSAISFFIM